MNSVIARLNAINKLRDELEQLNSPTGFHRLGESQFQKWDLFYRKSALIIKSLFGKNSQYLHDWLKIEIPEDPDIEDDKGFSTFLHKQGIAEEKMENQLDIMAQEISSSKLDANNKPVKRQKSDNKDVFIVHGTDYEPVKELKAILLEVGIKPIILHEQPSRGMTIIEKLEKYSDVGFAFVLLTPDDNGFGKAEFLSFLRKYVNKENASFEEIQEALSHFNDVMALPLIKEMFAFNKNRARQNVVLELGYFIGRLGRSKVCCLYKGDIELPSDIHGICYVHFNNSVNEVKDAIIEELKAADYP